MIRIIIRIIGACVAIGGVMWFLTDKGYEPVLTSITGLGTFLGTFHRANEQERSPFPPIQQQERSDTCEGMHDSLRFFSDRFTTAFPGVRDVKLYSNPQDCIRRLSIVLAKPLKFPVYTPIWWWRGYSNLDISSFCHLYGRKVLVNQKEIVINKIAAVNLGLPSKLFIYVEARPDKASGAYRHKRKTKKHLVEEMGYFWEEIGLVNDRYITREELDDGVAEINGITVELTGKEELRVRYLTSYNFIIAPQSSDINQKKFDVEFEKIMNGILVGEASIEDLRNAVNCLPPRETEMVNKMLR